MKNKVLLILLFTCFSLYAEAIYKKKQHYTVRGSLQNSFVRFEKERKGRVAFLGGSITEMKGWRNRIQTQLKQRFPYTEFEFVDAGIGSTGTTPHAFRLENDVLHKGAIDLLFVEGAVNDHTNGFSGRDQIRGMEGIVRHTLTANPYTDIIMLHFIYDPFLEMFRKGETPEVMLHHDRVAEHYDIPSINCAREIAQRIEAGEFTWDDFGGTHPNWFGHKFYADDIEALWDDMWSYSESPALRKHKVPAKLLDNYSYTQGKFVDLKEADIKNDWNIVDSWKPTSEAGTRNGFVNVPMLCTDKPGATLTYTFKGKAVGLFMVCGPSSGILEYSIDEGAVRKLDTYTEWSKHLYLPWLYVLEAELNPKKTHTITITLSGERNRESIGTECIIRNIVISE